MGESLRILFVLHSGDLKEFLALPGAAGMISGLDSEGISWACLQAEEVKNRIAYGKTDRRGDQIIITDNSGLAKELTEQGICVIGFQPPEKAGHYFPGAGMVLSSFEELDGAFFRNVLRHFLHLPVCIAETERLILRESTAEDFDSIFRMSRQLGPDATTDSFSGDLETEREKFLRYIQYAYSFFGFGLWTVEEKKSSAVIGRCGLMPAADRRTEEGRLELGYLIDSRQRGRGYAQEACRAVLQYAFRELECEEIYAGISRDNEESARLARRLGFVKQDVPEKDRGENSTDLWRLTKAGFAEET